MTMLGENAPIVLDNGSGICKAGFSDNDEPKVVFSSITGRPHNNVVQERNMKDCYVGQEAQEKRDILALSYPIEHGIITNWDDMEKIWDHTFHQLQVLPDAHSLLATEAPLNPIGNREKMTQIMFETYNIPGFYIGIQAVLSLYSYGRTTGVVLDCGDGVSQVMSFYDAYPVPESTKRIELGGRDLTEYLRRLLQNRGYCFSTSAEFETVRLIKEKVCYMPFNFEKEMTVADPSAEKEKSYELPDGSVITIGNEMFQCPEALFQPSKMGFDAVGIHELVHNSIMAAPIDVRRDLIYNIIVTGGTTMLPGFQNRMHNEMLAMVPDGMSMKVRCASDRRYSVWLGGAVLASLGGYSRMWITKAEYEENGPCIVHTKCRY